MSTLEELKAELKRRQPNKPIAARDITNLVTGIIELNQQTNAKLDQLIQAVEDQQQTCQGAKNTKATTKTGAKDKP